MYTQSRSSSRTIAREKEREPGRQYLLYWLIAHLRWKACVQLNLISANDSCDLKNDHSFAFRNRCLLYYSVQNLPSILIKDWQSHSSNSNPSVLTSSIWVTWPSSKAALTCLPWSCPLLQEKSIHCVFNCKVNINIDRR